MYRYRYRYSAGHKATRDGGSLWGIKHMQGFSSRLEDRYSGPIKRFKLKGIRQSDNAIQKQENKLEIGYQQFHICKIRIRILNVVSTLKKLSS